MEKPDPRIQRGGGVANGNKEIGLVLLDLVDDMSAGRIDARELSFCPAKPPHQRTAGVHGTWVVTIKGRGSGEPVVVDAEPAEEFTGSLF